MMNNTESEQGKYCAQLVALLLLCISCPITALAQPVINEVSPSNKAVLEDEDGDFPDWIELTNAGATSVQLGGYFISDDPTNLFKFELPDAELSAGAYFLLFASDKNRPMAIADSLYPHTNFKLSSGGETLFLSNADSVLINELTYPSLGTDQSYGWQNEALVIFTEPTPLAQNSTTGFSGQLEKPVVTNAGGFFSRNVTVQLQNVAQASFVYYTTDGTDPTSNSPLFGESSRTFSETTVLKLRAIQNGLMPSQITVHTYFVGSEHELPVVSLVTDPYYFFDENDGIYVTGPDEGNPNFQKDIEVPAHIEYFDTEGTLGFQSHIGTKIYGAYSRNFAQKSLSIFFRGEYGMSELKYPLFDEKEVDTFQSFILRNAGNDFGAAHMRDATMTTIVKEQIDMDVQAYQPAVLYINGEYWGIQNIREKISEHYVASNYNIDTDEVDLIEAGEEPEARNGTTDLYLEFLAALDAADIENQEEYEAVVAHIDLENYIDYMAIEIFYANTDWPGTNVKLWRNRNEAGKWRWFLYDTDHGFNLYSGEGDYNLDMMEHVLQEDPGLLKYGNPLWATKIFRILIQNEVFEQQFVNRMSDLMNTVFLKEHMLSVIDSLAARIRPEIPAHEERWNLISGWTGEGPFEGQVQDMKNWVDLRENYMVQHMQAHLRLRAREQITVNVSNAEHGVVLVNLAAPKTYPWSGTYFTDFDVPVTAIAKEGYRFIGWTGDVTSTDSVLDLEPGTSLTANFEPISGTTPTVVINEIMYNPPENPDTEDWVELFNATASTINMSGWLLKDEDDDHIFTIPDGTEISSGAYIVLTRNKAVFDANYSINAPVLGDFEFGLAGGSDQVRLFDADSSLIDFVSYDDESPWPSDADGTGYTLELINTQNDNGAPSNWQASTTLLGTPGAANSVSVATQEEAELPSGFMLRQNYPNPFNPSTVISYQLPTNSLVKLRVFDAAGRDVAELVNKIQTAGSHQVTFSAAGLASGIYLYRLEAGGAVQTQKMLLLK